MTQYLQDQIYTSNNYKEFIFFKGNRDIKSNKVNRMLDSIKTYGLINPIVVDQFKQVIDGQHRLECCKTLEIPVRFSVFNIEKHKLLSLVRDINSVQNNWNSLDIAEAYSIHSKNAEHYKRYLMILSLGVAHSTVIEICMYLSLGDPDARTSTFDFKNGNLVIPENVETQASGLIMLLKNSSIDKNIWNRIYFLRALLKLKREKSFNIYSFMDNYKKFPHQWKNAYTVEENIKSIITVHNYRNRQKAKYFFE